MLPKCTPFRASRGRHLSRTRDRVGKVDEVGLPLVYDKELIQKYWDSQVCHRFEF